MRLAIILVVVGLVLMAIGLPVAELESGEQFSHEVRAEQVVEAETMDNSTAVNWTDLSPEEQNAILRSYQKDEAVTLTTDEPLPDSSELDFEEDHWTLVKADGVYLLVGTSPPKHERTNTIFNWLGYVIAIIGLVLTVGGATREARLRGQ